MVHSLSKCMYNSSRQLWFIFYFNVEHAFAFRRETSFQKIGREPLKVTAVSISPVHGKIEFSKYK